MPCELLNTARTPSISAVFESLPLSSSEIRSGGKHDFSKSDHIGRSGKATSRNSRRRSPGSGNKRASTIRRAYVCIILCTIFYIIVLFNARLNCKYTYSSRAHARHPLSNVSTFVRYRFFVQKSPRYLFIYSVSAAITLLDGLCPVLPGSIRRKKIKIANIRFRSDGVSRGKIHSSRFSGFPCARAHTYTAGDFRGATGRSPPRERPRDAVELFFLLFPKHNMRVGIVILSISFIRAFTLAT